ncbi:MAG: hypothetical protein FJ276_01290 [Planctomycetes bacterium]|nr:hypothetical protein [Planctomycetota bacterium]
MDVSLTYVSSRESTVSSRHSAVALMLLALPVFLAILDADQAMPAEQHGLPNIVLVLADDLGWSDLACYGSDLHETPHLDRLSGQGVRFTNAYAASPVCTPTRASLLTGKYPARLHMTIWRESAAERGQRKLEESAFP